MSDSPILEEKLGLKGNESKKIIKDEGDFRDNPQKHLLKYLNISNLKRIIPKSARHYDKAYNLIKKRKKEEDKYSDADKFALGLMDCSAEHEFLIKSRLLTRDSSGNFMMTEHGLLMAAAIYNKFYSGELQARQIILQRKIKRRKKAREAKKSKRKNRK